MKLNNKGFAITSIIYSMLILFLTLVVLIISNLASRKAVFDKQKTDILEKIGLGVENIQLDDGSIVYFDITTGKVCNNYHEDNSKTGYNGTSTTKTTSDQNGCLKFYVFKNYEDEQRLNLLLDHNTTATVNWDDSGDNQYGPRTLLAKLQDDTGSWIGTEQPANYTDTLIEQTINYEGYKARLITEEDIYNITGVPNIYFFTTDGNPTETCREGDNSGCLYRWLYDNFDALYYEPYGIGGYWAADADTPTVNGVDFARVVQVETFNGNGVSETSYQGIPSGGGGIQVYGLRPVIEVLRNKITNKFDSNILPEEYQQVE